MTRDELIAAARAGGRVNVSEIAAERAVDVVLDEVLRIAVPRLESDYAGSEVLQKLYELRGLRPARAA